MIHRLQLLEQDRNLRLGNFDECQRLREGQNHAKMKYEVAGQTDIHHWTGLGRKKRCMQYLDTGITFRSNIIESFKNMHIQNIKVQDRQRPICLHLFSA